MAKVQQVWIRALSDLRVGDVVIDEGEFGYPRVERTVKPKPFVPEPEVWRSLGSPNGAVPIPGRQNLDVHNPESGGWTRYVRKDED
jgi:hypothetical protein